MTVGVATNSREMSNYYHFDSGKDGKLSAAFDANFTKVRYFKWDDANMSKYFGPTQNYSLDVDYEMDQNNSLNLYLNYENTNQQFKKFTSASGPFSYLGIYNVDRKSASLTYNGQNDNSNYMLSATYGELKKDVTSAMSANSVGSSKFNFWNIEARDTIKLDNNNRLTFGGEFRTDGRKDSSIDESSDQYSLFIHDELKLGEKLLLIPAVRYDHHDSFGSETSPNIGATYSFTEGSRLKANYGEGYRAPSISELYGTYSNPNLRPEKSKGYELSYEQEFGDDTAIKLTYFKNKKTDAIAMDYSLAPNYQYMNIEKSSSEGVEFEIKHDLGNGFTVIGNYDYLDAMNDKTNTRLNYSARNTYTAKLMWTEPVKQEWNITAWNKWYSDYRADSEDHSINTFNFVVNKRWGDKYRAYAGIDNLFDNFASCTDNFRNLIHVDLHSCDLRCIFGQFFSGFCNSFQHNFVEDIFSCSACLCKSLFDHFECQTFDLHIHLDGCDTFGSTSYFKVHIAEEVFYALDVCDFDKVIICVACYQTNGNTSNGTFDRYAGSHK